MCVDVAADLATASSTSMPPASITAAACVSLLSVSDESSACVETSQSPYGHCNGHCTMVVLTVADGAVAVAVAVQRQVEWLRR